MIYFYRLLPQSNKLKAASRRVSSVTIMVMVCANLLPLLHFHQFGGLFSAPPAFAKLQITSLGYFLPGSCTRWDIWRARPSPSPILIFLAYELNLADKAPSTVLPRQQVWTSQSYSQSANLSGNTCGTLYVSSQRTLNL